MTEPPNLPAILIGAIAAAGVGGLFALANVVMGKELKNSEARKDWIDGLRTNLASMFGRAQAVSLLWEAELDVHNATPLIDAASKDRLPTETVRVFRQKNESLYTSLLQSFHDVQLRLGTNGEDEYVSLRNALDTVYRAFEGNDPSCHKVFAKNYPELRTMAAAVMKKEWIKVRDGEPAFRTIKTILKVVLWSTVALIVVGLFVLMCT